MISLNSVNFTELAPFVDNDGAITSAVVNTRRMERVQAFNGLAFLLDGGFADGDLTLGASCNHTDYKYELLHGYIRNFGGVNQLGDLTLSCEHGAYQGAMQDLSTDGQQITFNFLPTKQLDYSAYLAAEEAQPQTMAISAIFKIDFYGAL